MLLRHTRLFGVLAAGAFAASAYLVPSTASAVEYSGKKITILVPFREGGGADTIARLFQPYLKKYLPGNPTVIVRNKPGGGSVKGANDFERRAKKDGTTVMVISTSTLVAYVIGGKKIKYDVLKWRPVFSTPQDTVFYVRPETGVKGKDIVADIKALRKFKGLIFG
ncbi:MAG: tricarboxylate transporter, partial [Proteobacteria bacterium]|nr:tricarboxylate transporter [Pseudomonadota bacterium]